MKKVVYVLMLGFVGIALAQEQNPVDVLRSHDAAAPKAASIKELFEFYSQGRVDKIEGRLEGGGDADSNMLAFAVGGVRDREKGELVNESVDDESAVLEFDVGDGDKYIVKFVAENDLWKIDKILLDLNI